MSYPTLVNSQVTDAVTQANVKNLGDSTAQAMATVYQTLAQATGVSMQNLVSKQQQMNTIDLAATAQEVNLLYTMDPASAAVSTQNLLTGNAFAQGLAQLQAALAGSQQGSKIADTTPPVTPTTAPATPIVGAGPPVP